MIAARLAAQRPFWEPGSAYGYHAYVIGALTGEVIRRVTGRSIQEIFEERVRAPYGLDFYLGLPEELTARRAETLPLRPAPEQAERFAAREEDPTSIVAVAGNRNGSTPTELVAFSNNPTVVALGPTSTGGVGTARGVAGMYAAAIGEVAGRAARTFRNCRAVVLPRIGHVAMMERPELVAAEIRTFLRRLEQQAFGETVPVRGSRRQGPAGGRSALSPASP